MPSLTVREAQVRAALLEVLAYDLELDLTIPGDTFSSSCLISFDTTSAGCTFVDVSCSELTRAELDDEPLDPSLLSGGRLPLDLTDGRHRLRLEAVMPTATTARGCIAAPTPPTAAPICTRSAVDAAPRIFGCFDQPDLKAVYRTQVSVPEDRTVLGNAPATSLGGGRWELAQTLPLSTYFWTLVAGPYHSVLSEHDGIPLGIHCTQWLARHLDVDADEIFTVTGQSFDAYHAMFGIRYPFGDYHQVFVPEFNFGAMENPGCVTLRDSMVFRSKVPDGERGLRARVIVHEMAHQWFGDLVTMRWWDDLWLNESFAEYMAHRVTDEATGFTDSWVAFGFVRKRWGLMADSRPSTHPVASNGANDVRSAFADFDGISYAKGPAVLKQLNTYLGDEVFLAGVRQHLNEHAYGNATLADMLAAWESCGARELGPWADAWLRTSGADTLSHDDSLVRTPPAGSDAERPHSLVIRVLGDGEGERDVAVQVTSPRTQVPVCPGPGRALVLDGRDDTRAKVRYDADTRAALPAVLGRIDDPVTRAAIWLAVRDGVGDAVIGTDAALDLLTAALPTEDQDIAVRSLSGWAARTVIGQYLGGEPSARDRVAEALARRLHSAPPGSGLQLAAAQGLAEVCVDTALFRGWLDGAAPDGLVVDAELRWKLLLQMAWLGAVEALDVEDERRRDASSKGAIHAARCRAALPDAASKAEVWDRIISDGSLSNYELSALCEGFWHPDQSALLDGYVDRYFAELPSTASLRSGWVVAETALLGFPVYAVRQQTYDRAQALLAADPLDAGLRRAVADRADDLRRALRVRAAAVPESDADR